MPVAAPVTKTRRPANAHDAAARALRRGRAAWAAETARSTRSSPPSPRRNSSTRRPSETTRKRSQRPTTSSSSEATTTSADALVGELDDEAVDLGAGRGVDALGGLVEQEHARGAHQHAGEEQLLLVAAGEMRDRALRRGGLDVELRASRRRMALRSRSPLTRPRLREVGEVADGDVGADRQVEEQAVALAVLGQERDAGARGRRAASGSATGRPSTRISPCGGHAAVDAVRGFRCGRSRGGRRGRRSRRRRR